MNPAQAMRLVTFTHDQKHKAIKKLYEIDDELSSKKMTYENQVGVVLHAMELYGLGVRYKDLKYVKAKEE